MIATLGAVKSALTPLGYPVHLFVNEGITETTVPEVPYLVIAPANSTGLLPEELSVCGADDSIEFDLRVTAVSYPADAVPKIQARVRGVLAPGLGVARVPLPGRFVTTAYQRTEVTSQFDRDMTVTQSNRHPSWGVDTYRLSSQPDPASAAPDESSSASALPDESSSASALPDESSST